MIAIAAIIQFWKWYSWLLIPDAHNCCDFGNSEEKKKKKKKKNLN